MATARIYLELLRPDLMSEHYPRWLNDPDVNRFLESRWKVHTRDELVQYVVKTNDGTTNFLFGIFDKDSKRHIGNIKIGDINQFHRHGDVGLLIGEKEFWKQGIGSAAIALAVSFAFMHLNLNKVTAGMYAANTASWKAFLKNGFREIGRLRKHVFFEGQYIDGIKMELLREDWIVRQKTEVD